MLHGRERPCEICPTFSIYDENSAAFASIWKREDGKTYLNLTEPTPDKSLTLESLLEIPEDNVSLFKSHFEKQKGTSFCSTLGNLENKILKQGKSLPIWMKDLRTYFARRLKPFTYFSPTPERERTSGPTSV